MSDTSPANVPSYRLTIVRSRPYRAITGAWHAPALLACSGGTDSTALVMLAREALRSKRVGPFVVAHVDHRSRPESASEAVAVRCLCECLGVPFIAAQADSASVAAGESLERVWRERRYRALFNVCRRMGIQTVVTAHTLDDQVENVLMRLFSGSSRLTMRSASFREFGGEEVQLLRPLLDVPRSELLKTIEAAGVEPVQDPSNADRRFRRNAVRHEVVPAIENVYPRFERALIHSAQVREEDADYGDRVAAEAFRETATIGERFTTLRREYLIECHPAIASRLVLLAVRALIGDTDTREMTHERVQSVLRAASGRTGAVIELPYGIRATVEREQMTFVSNLEGPAID